MASLAARDLGRGARRRRAQDRRARRRRPPPRGEQLPGAAQGTRAPRMMADGPSPPFRHAVALVRADQHRRAALDPARRGAAEASWTSPPTRRWRRGRAGARRPPRPAATTPHVVGRRASRPARRYWYRFDAGGDGLAGRADPDASWPGRDGRSASRRCAARDYSVAPLGVYRALAEREVDLVLHLGDYIYEDDGSRGAAARPAARGDDARRLPAPDRADPRPTPTRRPSTCAIRWSRSGTTTTWPTTPGGTAPSTTTPTSTAPGPTVSRPPPRPARSGCRPGCPSPHDPLTTWRSMLIGDLAELLLLDTRLGTRPAGRRRRVPGPRRPGALAPR